jgi:hypothetical protein
VALAQFQGLTHQSEHPFVFLEDPSLSGEIPQNGRKLVCVKIQSCLDVVDVQTGHKIFRFRQQVNDASPDEDVEASSFIDSTRLFNNLFIRDLEN